MDTEYLLKQLDEAARSYSRMSIEAMAAGAPQHRQYRNLYDLLMQCRECIEEQQKELSGLSYDLDEARYNQ
jgi:flagellar biosynthesis chaperone FliJ